MKDYSEILYSEVQRRLRNLKEDLKRWSTLTADQIDLVCMSIETEVCTKFGLDIPDSNDEIYYLPAYYPRRGGTLSTQQVREILAELGKVISAMRDNLVSSKRAGKPVELEKATEKICTLWEKWGAKRGWLMKKCRQYLVNHSIKGKPGYTPERLANNVKQLHEKHLNKQPAK